MSTKLDTVLTKHLHAVESYGNTERGVQAWQTTEDQSRNQVLPGELKKRDEAWQAVCESAKELIAVAQSNT